MTDLYQAFRPQKPHLRTLLAAAAVGVACSLAALAAAGGKGLAGGLIALALALAFLSSGYLTLLVSRAAQNIAGMGMAVLILTYITRLMLVVIGFVLVDQADVVDGLWFGVTIMATALTWSVVHALTAIRASKREPTIDPNPR